MADNAEEKKIENKADEKPTTKTNSKKAFKPGRKPAVSTKKNKYKSKPKTEKVEPTTKQVESENVSFSQIVVLIALITIIVLAIIIYILVGKRNKLQTELDTKNNELQSISSEVQYFREYQDKMDNLIDQASELSDEAHAKDLFILQNIHPGDNTKIEELPYEELSKIKNIRYDFLDAYEDLDWEDVSKYLVNGMSSEQRAQLEGLKIREITVKDSREVKYTNDGNVYYEINIVVRRKGNSNYEEGDNTRYIIFKKINDDYKVDLVEKIN